MTCHSSNCFSIVWGQGNAPLVNSLPSSCYMALEQHCVLLMQLVLILFSSSFWFNEVHLELSVQNSIEGGIPSESHCKSLNYREGKTTVLFGTTFTWTIILNLLMK